MKIRKATQNDVDVIRGVYLAAFPEGERDLISDVAVKMLFEEVSPPVLSLVAEVDDIIIGHVAFSPVTSQDTKECRGYILAPLAVSPSHQKRGIASQLIKNGVGRISELGSGILFVYGDPGFYSRFGFGADHAEYYTPPYQLEYALGWQAMAMGDFDIPSSAISISCVPSLCNAALW